MDFFGIIKQLADLGMVGLSLAVAGGLAYVLVLRERDGLSQLKDVIGALARAVEALGQENKESRLWLEKHANSMTELAKQVDGVSKDVDLLKHALVSVGVKSFVAGEK
jgi:prefoldin subunit 5